MVVSNANASCLTFIPRLHAPLHRSADRMTTFVEKLASVGRTSVSWLGYMLNSNPHVCGGLALHLIRKIAQQRTHLASSDLLNLHIPAYRNWDKAWLVPV